jgi:cobalt-zinc-cadmium resistance protein CzcA
MLKYLISQCVQRRLATLVVALVIAIFGVHAYLETPIEAYPDVTNTQVTVISLMPGYAPEEVERQVTIPLERALNGVPGMLQMRSQSLFGLSLITLTFNDGVDSFHSRTLVTERLASADLPEGVQPRLAPDYTPLGEIYKFILISDRHSLYELRSEMEWNVSRILKQVQGVADVLTFGGFYKEIHIEIDPIRMESFDLTLEDINQAITHSNRNIGAGFFRHGDQQMVIRGVGLLSSPEDIRKIVLKSAEGTPVTVGDVSRLVQGATPRQGSVGLDEHKEVVEGIVLLRRGQNPSRVLDALHERVEELNHTLLPPGMRVVPFLDRTELVHRTLHTVYDNLLHGFLLVVGVVWLFLRSLKASLIIAVVIPLSLLVAFLGLYQLGLPANLISMGAIDFGIILDGAVVVVENIIHKSNRHRPNSKRELIQLIATSALDVSRPTFYAMLIIIAALLPVFTLERVEGRIFRPLALTYSFALVGGLSFALTVVPALCAVLMRQRNFMVAEPRFLSMIRHLYSSLLGLVLKARFLTLMAALLLLATGGVALMRVGTEFLPELDEGDIHIYSEMPSSVALESGQNILLDVRKRLLEFPEVLSILSQQGRSEDGTDNEGVNMGRNFVHLKPQSEWRPGLDKRQLVEEMRKSLLAIPGVGFNFSQPIRDNVEESVSGVRGKVVLKIQGPDLEKMRTALLAAKEKIRTVSGVTDLALYRDSQVPQLQIQIDRDSLARQGVTVDSALETLETSLSGKVLTDMWQSERPVPIRVILSRNEQGDLDQVGKLMMPSASRGLIPLREIANIGIKNSRMSIDRESNIRFLALKFNVKDRDLGSVIHDAIEVVQREVKLPEGHFFAWGGEFENQQRAMGRLSVVVPIAVLIVFGLLYTALQSAISSIAILLSTPFAMTGGVFVLLLRHIPLSVSATIGFIALLGQVSLMGLLVLSATNERCQSGMQLIEAIRAGATERLRPVLMASMLALLGLLPMAVSKGIGSETQQPFAVVIVGGMFTTFLVAMFVLPVIYSLLAPKHLLSPGEESLDLDEVSK